MNFLKNLTLELNGLFEKDTYLTLELNELFEKDTYLTLELNELFELVLNENFQDTHLTLEFKGKKRGKQKKKKKKKSPQK